MIVGTIGAVGSGLGMPLMTILFGELINTFGSNQNNNNDIVHAISKVKTNEQGWKTMHFFTENM